MKPNHTLAFGLQYNIGADLLFSATESNLPVSVAKKQAENALATKLLVS